MTRRTLLGVAAMGLALAVAPDPAEAAHRHSRSCGHRYSDSRHRYDGYRSSRYRAPRPPAYVYGYDPYYSDYGYYGSRYAGPYSYDPYAYGYSRPYRYSRYGYSRPYYRDSGYHYHGRNRCSRPHFSIHIGF